MQGFGPVCLGNLGRVLEAYVGLHECAATTREYYEEHHTDAVQHLIYCS